MDSSSTFAKTTGSIEFDVQAIRADFPILGQELSGKPLVYLDNAATTQKPGQVIEALTRYYNEYNANIHRGLHTLAEKATETYEETRRVVKEFINASETAEIIFTRGTTEGINLVAESYGSLVLSPGKEVLISGMEHHSNIVPWQLACQKYGASLKVIPVLDNGTLDLEAFHNLLKENTAIVAVVYASNSLGTINPIKEITEAAHKVGAKVLVDGAQATSHLDINVQALNADFYCFSSHKLYGPTGVGVLYGKRALLDAMPPYQGGGEMIKEVSFEQTTYNELPYKFEAGTPNIGDTIALKEAILYVNSIGKPALKAWEDQLLAYAYSQLKEVPNLTFYGTAPEKVSVVSFLVNGLHPQDLGILLDQYGVAVRTGHHCTQPLMHRFGIPGTVRASFAFYNTFEEVDILVGSLKKAIKMLS